MNSIIANLLLVLQELIDEHKQLIEYSSAKTEVIRRNDLDGIAYISAKEKKNVQRIQELERYRIALVSQYGIEIKIRRRNGFTMEQLVQAVYHPDEKQQLKEKASELSAALRELQEINDLNQTLIKLALEYVDFAQDLLLGPDDEDVTYHRAVQGLVQQRGGRFNTRT